MKFIVKDDKGNYIVSPVINENGKLLRHTRGKYRVLPYIGLKDKHGYPIFLESKFVIENCETIYTVEFYRGAYGYFSTQEVFIPIACIPDLEITDNRIQQIKRIEHVLYI